MQVESGVGSEEKLGEQAHAVRINLVDHDNKAAAMPCLVFLDQLAPKVAGLMLGTPQRRVAEIYVAAVRRR